MKRKTCLALASAILVSAAGCTDSDDGDTDETETPEVPEQPEQPAPQPAPQPATAGDYDELAQAVATVVVTGVGGGDVASISDSIWLSLGVRPDGFAFDAAGRIRGKRFGVDYQYELTCLDGAGESLDGCTDRTDSSTVDVTWSGQLDTANFDAAITRTGRWTLTDIQSGLATLGGSSNFGLNSTFTGLFEPVTRTYHLDFAAQYSDIKIDVDHKQVISGSAEYTVNAERMVSGAIEATFAARALVTFEPDRVIIVLDGQHTYHVDVHTGAVTRA